MKSSKAAVISFYETLRVEVGREIGITIVTPGLVESEMTQGKFMSKDGRLYLDKQLRDVSFYFLPLRSLFFYIYIYIKPSSYQKV